MLQSAPKRSGIRTNKLSYSLYTLYTETCRSLADIRIDIKQIEPHALECPIGSAVGASAIDMYDTIAIQHRAQQMYK